LAITKGVLGSSTKHCAYQIPVLPVGSRYRVLPSRRSEQAKTFWILVVGSLVAKVDRSGQRVT
jgi:hypothetical protein